MAFQGIFRRSNKFVAVKPIHLSAKVTLEVGTVIDLEKHHVRPFQLRMWFQRRRVGTLDSPWANMMLEGVKRPESEGIIRKSKPDVEDHPQLVGLETEQGLKDLVSVLSAVKDSKAPDGKAAEPKAVDAAVTDAQAAHAKAKAAKKVDAERERKDAKNKRERERRAAKKVAKK